MKRILLQKLKYNFNNLGINWHYDKDYNKKHDKKGYKRDNF